MSAGNQTDMGRASKSDADQHVTDDLACLRCGYNLRMQDTAGDCPECGTPIATSLNCPWLQYRDSMWVRGLARGIVWLTIASITSETAMLLPRFLSIHQPSQIRGIMTFSMIVFAISIIFFITGTWLMTRESPDGLCNAPRRLITFWVVLTGAIASAAIFIWSVLTWDIPPHMYNTFRSMYILSMLLGVAATYLYITHIAYLARQLPSRRMAIQYTIIKWLALLYLVVMMTRMALLMWGQIAIVMNFEAVTVGVSIMYYIMLPWWLILQIVMAVRLYRAARRPEGAIAALQA